jgi:hypothetical protein
MLYGTKLTLFTQNNYRFSTSDEGRPTSLYFEDNLGNQGRWRRGHHQGELLCYQGQSLRLFIEPEAVESYLFGLEAHNIRLPKQQQPRFGNRAYGDYLVLQRGVIVRGISLAPIQGWHVLELCSPDYYARHGSSGTVELNDHTAPAANYATIPNIQNTVDWTL